MPHNVENSSAPWTSRYPALWGIVVLFAHILAPLTLLLWGIRKLGGAYDGHYRQDVPSRVVEFHEEAWSGETPGIILSVGLIMGWAIGIVSIMEALR